MNRFAAVYPCDDGQRGLVAAVYPSMRQATEDLDIHPGAKVVATARNLMTGEFVHVGDGWSADKPRWPTAAPL